MIKRWVYVALAFGLGMSAMSCENQKFNDVKVDEQLARFDAQGQQQAHQRKLQRMAIPLPQQRQEEARRDRRRRA